MLPPVGHAWCFVSKHGSHSALVLDPLMWADLRAQAAGYCSVWKDRQFCRFPLAPRAKLQAEVGFVGFLSICQPTALQGHCEGDAGQVLHEKSPPSHPPLSGLAQRSPVSNFTAPGSSQGKEKRQGQQRRLPSGESSWKQLTWERRPAKSTNLKS